jgi:hypothetical protein
MVFLQEWQSPNFHQLVYSPLLLAVLAVASVGVVGVFPGALGFCYSLSTLLFLAISLRSARHAPLFGVSIVPILATALVTRFPRIAGLASRYSPRIVGSVITLAVAVSISIAPNVSKVAPQTGYRPNDRSLPRQSIEYLRSKDSAPLFNEYAWGGYCWYS